MTLQPLLVALDVVEAAECRRETAKRPDQLELCGDEVDNETEPRLAREVEPVLGLALHLGERITAGEELRDQAVAAKGRVGEVSGLLRRVEGVPRGRAVRPGMPYRGIREVSESQVDPGLQAVHPRLFHQVQPELAEAETRLIVAEIQPQHGAYRGVGVTRCVAIAVLQAKVPHAAYDKAAQVLVGEQGRRHERGENLHRPAHDRICHARQVEQSLDRVVPELPPYPRVFLLDFLSHRMCRPSDTDAA
jgi:hypothetical protein